MKRAIHPKEDVKSSEIAVLGFMYPTNETKIRYPCGHSDKHAIIIKVPERLYDACRARGWLHSVNSWNCVVAFHHPKAGKREVKEIGFESERCSDCVIATLNEDLNAIDDKAAAVSHVRAATALASARGAAKRPPYASRR